MEKALMEIVYRVSGEEDAIQLWAGDRNAAYKYAVISVVHRHGKKDEEILRLFNDYKKAVQYFGSLVTEILEEETR